MSKPSYGTVPDEVEDLHGAPSAPFAPPGGGGGGSGSSLPIIDNNNATKQGHTCFGCCCDVRRGSIIVDIITIVSLLLDIIALFAIETIEDVDDDHIQEALSHLSASGLTAIFVSEIILLGVSIYGAVKFSPYLVLVGFIVYCLGVAMSIMPFNLVGIIINVLFAYPHWFLYMEIQMGIMSPSNYYNEEQSCCCV